MPEVIDDAKCYKCGATGVGRMESDGPYFRRSVRCPECNIELSRMYIPKEGAKWEQCYDADGNFHIELGTRARHK